MTHSGPFVRGIYLTLAVDRRSGGQVDNVRALFERSYSGRPFVRILENPPELTHAVGSNNALIHVAEDETHLQVSVAIDNLIKGAGGQAVQGMNLALGIPEDRGLRIGGMFPC